MRSSPGQLDLFAPRAAGVLPAVPSPQVRALARALPGNLHLGGSTWSYPGWTGLVYASAHPTARLAQEGLGAYAQHPLLRAVGVDRTFYSPLTPQAFAEYAAQVPPDFRFVVKAHELCTSVAVRGEPSPYFLDATYAREQVVAPAIEGLGEKLGLILFQFPPQDAQRLGGVDAFINRLYRFLRALPGNALYAVEVRNEELLTERFRKALELAGAVPTLAGWGALPRLTEQAERTGALDSPALFIRWMLHRNLDFEEAERRYEPFSRIVDEDPETRNDVVTLCQAAEGRDRPTFLIVGNSAEGCGPLTLEAVAERLGTAGG